MTSKKPPAAGRQTSKPKDTDTESQQLASALLQIRSARESQKRTKPSTTMQEPYQVSGQQQPQGRDAFQAQGQPEMPPPSQYGTSSSHTSTMMRGMTVHEALASLRACSNQHILPLVGPGRLGDQLGGSFNTNATHLAAFQRQELSNPFALLSSLDFLGSNRPSSGGSNPINLQPSPPSTRAQTETADTRERPDSLVRKEQVEAALKSKPQRGRKRDDLNDMERLELTRTRNREHAKTTRIRKKQRYEELLHEERQLQDLRKKEILEKARRAAVVRYVNARQLMIRSKHRSEDSISSEDNTQTDQKSALLLKDLVEDINNFVFEVTGEAVDEGSSTLDRMSSYDDSLAYRIRTRYGSDALAYLQYAVLHGDEGVCLNCGNGGTAEVDITLTTEPRTPLLKGFLRVLFSGPDSTKLSLVSWSPMKDYTEEEPDRLNVQVSHPSVVSLDPALRLEGGTNEDSQNGPGMSI